MLLSIDVILDRCIITKMYIVLDICCNHIIIFNISSPALNTHVLFELGKLFHRVFDFNCCTMYVILYCTVTYVLFRLFSGCFCIAV